MNEIENLYRIARNPAYSGTHRDLAARAITRAGRPAAEQTIASAVCRSCGFAAHDSGDLIDGQCPRWAAGR